MSRKKKQRFFLMIMNIDKNFLPIQKERLKEFTMFFANTPPFRERIHKLLKNVSIFLALKQELYVYE